MGGRIHAVISSISRFNQPYPQTHLCATPVEDQTNKKLCRSLPVDRMPPPPDVERPGNAWFWELYDAVFVLNSFVS